MSEGSRFYVDPDAAGVYKGYLLPGKNLISALVSQLKVEIANNPELEERWKTDPGSVLADRGVTTDYRKEILKAEGIPVPEGDGCDGTVYTGCCITVLAE